MPKLNRIYAAIENRLLDISAGGKLLTRKTTAIAERAHDSVPTDWYFIKNIRRLKCMASN